MGRSRACIVSSALYSTSHAPLPAGADEISNFSKQVCGFGMCSKFVRIDTSNRGDPLLLKCFSVHCAVSQDCDKVDALSVIHARARHKCPSFVPIRLARWSSSFASAVQVSCGSRLLKTNFQTSDSRATNHNPSPALIRIKGCLCCRGDPGLLVDIISLEFFSLLMIQTPAASASHVVSHLCLQILFPLCFELGWEAEK